MILEPAVVLALLVVFIASLARSTFGFGDALIAMPLLTILVGIQAAAPWIAILSVTLAGLIVLRDWRRIRLAGAWRLVVSSCLGIPIGLYFLVAIPENVVKSVLAVVIIAFASYCLIRPDQWTLKTDRTSFLFGFAAGILGGAYNTQGPPMVIFGTLRRWSAEQFRATLQGVFLPTSVLIVAGHAWQQRVTGEVARLYLFSLPLVAFALPLGRWINRRAIAARFVRWVHVLLIVIGVSLLVNVVWSIV